MSATAATLERLSRPRSAERAPAELSPRISVRVLAFSALAFLAGARFSSLLAHPPLARVLAIVAVASAIAAALSATGARELPAPARTALRIAIVAAGAFAAMLAAGAPTSALWPWHWGRVERIVSHGLGELDGRWPYTGDLAQARVAVMLALPASMVPAAALAFWPSARRRVRAHAAALALLLLLYTMGEVNESHAGWQVQGAVLLLLLCAWGWAWRPRALDLEPALACALAATIAAILLAGALAAAKPLLDYRAWNPFGNAYPPASFDWNQTYQALAWPKSQETMVEVSSRSPHLWRATTLDRFDGVRFLRSERIRGSGSGLPSVAVDPAYLERASFVLRGLRSTQLLSPGEALTASITGTGLSHLAPISPDGSVSLSGAPAPSGDRYTVNAYVPRPTIAAMLASPPVFPVAYLAYVQFGLRAGAHARGAPVTVTAANHGVIEASPYAGVFRLAHRLAAGARSTYALVAKVEAFLRRGFAYDESPPRTSYPLVSFLLSQRRGYCQQFSGAMTLLLRMDGVPARVAAGFLPGTLDHATGLYRVSASDAHAWVEVYFAGIGWVPFDPTPPAPATHDGALLAELAPGGGAHRPALEAGGTHRGAAALRQGAKRAQAAGHGTLTPLLALALGLALLLAAAWTLGTFRLRRAFA
ncbi:MAG TPA: transglutaminase-like domain-containing protein, partial [Solirubrobacteraceae bacterium]|nr:transglutaminase-like domain-containing protein [Solirubrobacteraceae bacterium]